MVYPVQLFPHLDRGGEVVLVGSVDADEAPVERIDDTTIRERTRSQCKGAPSAPSRVDPAVPREEEDGPVQTRDLGAGATGKPQASRNWTKKAPYSPGRLFCVCSTVSVQLASDG